MIHFEIVVEDSSGRKALEGIMPNLIGDSATFNIHEYKGLGHIPKGLKPNTDPRKRILLDQLPRIVGGFGRAFAKDPLTYRRIVVIVCDLDDRDEDAFRHELQSVIDSSVPKPSVHLCLAIEEGEAWLLGDADAVVEAYPKINRNELSRYVPDSICGTWELLADLVEKGGSRALRKLGQFEIGRAKHRWAASIAPKIDTGRNRSPSFQDAVAKIKLELSQNANALDQAGP